MSNNNKNIDLTERIKKNIETVESIEEDDKKFMEEFDEFLKRNTKAIKDTKAKFNNR